MIYRPVDGIEAGNGFAQEKCPSRNCLSNGYCNVCGLIDDVAEGCHATSLTPVCDADKDTTGIQLLGYPAAAGKEGVCVQCEMSGNQLIKKPEYAYLVLYLFLILISSYHIFQRS